ncbi:hypothetical protein JRO89_XS12G0008600 [Xanthoceras sorbifolium]|uniref:Uncharacterized protein n=1 Tax=Xanthoceras sorbifolium TaxID=99658 RepID=A0ABQ8HA96_9ROSI|nr:hypothetical protein JRO89_XS12G0008600 [Xanthoceras sorbifolium]
MHQSSPQLARMMINNYTIMSTTSSPKTACVPENRLPYMAPAATSSPMGREDQEKSYNEIVREISDFFKKYPAHPYHDGQMDHRINVNDPQTTRQSNLNVGSSSTTTRGHQRPLDGISMKLERFKIRTVQKGEGEVAAGVVKLLPIRSQHQLADMFTKPLPSTLFFPLLSKMAAKDIVLPP